MAAEGSALSVYFLDVGQGDCTFIVPPEGEGDPIMFDCADPYVAERFIANHEIMNLTAVVASHLDIDHVRGLLPFLKTHFEEGRRVRRLVLFPDRVPKEGRHKALRALVSQAVEWERHPPHDGFTLKPNHRDGDGPLLLAEGDGWRVELVLPWLGAVAEAMVDGDDPNHCSAVLRVTRGRTSVLVGGDAPLGSWERLEPNLRRARVIRVPHHGGEIREHGKDWSTFDDLYTAVEAELSVVSVGTQNRYSHPSTEHIAAARRGGACRLLCTQLTPTCHEHPELLRDEALVNAGGVEYPYRHRVVEGHPSRRPAQEVPCAGSVVVWLSANGDLRVEPSIDEDHSRFLRRVDRPRCTGEP